MKKIKDMMKNEKRKIFIPLISLAVILLVSLLSFSVWYFTPKIFLEGVSCEEIASLVVFNGNTGHHFVIESDEEISAIVSNIQNISMRRDKISSGYSGSAYHLYFKDTEGETIDFFIVNSDTTIRDDPFFYRIRGEEDLCFNYLFELEKLYVQMNEADEAMFVKKDSEEVDFAVTVNRIAPVVNITELPDVAVINSESELESYFDSRGEITTEVSFATEYNDEYFKDNVLVLIIVKERSSSVLYRGVDYAGITDEGKLALFMSKDIRSEEMSQDIAYWYICLEVAAEIEDTADVIVYCNSVKIHEEYSEK